MEPLWWSQFACTSPIGVAGRRKETTLWSSSEPVTCQMLGMSTCSRSWRKVTSPRIPKWVCWLSSNLNACTVSMEMKKEEVARYSALSFQKYEESGSTLFFRIQFMCDLKEWNKVCETCICLCVWSVSGCGVLYIHMHIGFSYVLQCAYTCIGRKLSRLKKVQVSYQLTYMPCVGTCRHGSSDVITSHIHNFSLSMNMRSASHLQEFHRCFRHAIIFKSQHYNTCMFTNIMYGVSLVYLQLAHLICYWQWSWASLQK